VPTVGGLLAVVPENATVTITSQGKTIEQALGGWRSDSLKPGTYEVSAAVTAPDGCPTASKSQRTKVTLGKLARVALNPKPCGLLSFDALPKGSNYQITSLTPSDSLSPLTGIVPAQNLVLPVGEYALRIRASRCADYGDNINVTAGTPIRLRAIRLICQ
jgi:hypothetical protein